MMRGRGAWFIALGFVALALLVGRAISTLVVDHAWYEALGATAVWREKMIALAFLKGGAWLLGSGFVFANLWAVRRTIRAIAVPARVGDLDFIEVIPANRLLSATLLVSAMIGVLFTVPLDDWTILAMAWQGQPFAEYEGYFQRDLGFYVYWLPFENAVYTWALVVIVVVTAIITVLYSITRDLRLVNRQIIASTHVRRHLTALGSAVLLLLAWSYRIDAYELLLWGDGFDGMFSRVDHVYTMRIDIALAVGTLAAALVVLRAGWIGQIRAAFVTITLVLIGTLLLRQAGPSIVQSAALVGVDSVQNRDYEATRALYTRRAFHVAGIQFLSAPDRGIDGGTDTVPPELAAALLREPTSPELQRQRRRASRDVALWDADVLTRLRAPGEAAFTGVVPPVWQSGPDGPQAVIVTRSSSVTPVWDVRVVPGTSAGAGGVPLLARHQQLGSRTLPVPIVAPDLSEHLVVRGDGVAALRDADVGLRALRQSDDFSSPSLPAAELRSLGARLAHAWTTRDVSLLSAEEEEVAVVLHRDVRARVARLVPALTQGLALTPIIHAGGLVWAIDLYSASAYYPLSLRFMLAGAPRSYFRLAGLALVDAQTGRVTIVPAAAPDPIARTQFAWLEELLLARTNLPSDVRAQLPIPTDGAMAQLRAFSRVGSARTGHVARYVPDSLQGPVPFPVGAVEDEPGAISWMVPIVDEAEQLVGVLEATGGADRRTRWHAMAQPLARWGTLALHVSEALDSVSASARRESDGPTIAGAVRVRIVESQPVLVRPSYASEGGELHLLALAALDPDAIWTGRTPEQLFDGGSGSGDGGDWPATAAERERLARRLYDAIGDALRQSDWVRFGATFDSLGRVLDRSR